MLLQRCVETDEISLFLHDKFPEYQRYDVMSFNKIVQSILTVIREAMEPALRGDDYYRCWQRKIVKKSRKMSKNVKFFTVTQGDDEEYDIEDVLKKLEISKVPEMPNEKSKGKQKKKKGKKKNSAETDVNIENPDQDQPRSDQPVEASVDEDQNVNAFEDPEQEQLLDEIEENNSNTNDKPSDEVPSEPECTTCFEPRIRTFLLLPCGHATFCEKCAAFFCENEDKNSRRCPTCRTMITGKIRAFF